MVRGCNGHSVPETPIRLANGDSEGSGRVELYLQGGWGTVSDNNFDDHDLRVICSMLGYESLYV